MRQGLRWLLAIAAIPLLYLLAAALGAFVPADGTTQAESDDTVVLKLIRGPIHYDFLLPADDKTRSLFVFAEDAGVPVDNESVEWILVGWGARTFYTTVGGYVDVSLRAILLGVFGDAAVLRVDAWGELPEEHPSIRTLEVSATQYDALLASISQDITGAASIDHPGFTATDAFFPANGPFNIFRTCNVWIGERLADAGLRIGRWTPTPYSVTLSLAWFGEG